MFQWTTFWQNAANAIIVALVGGLWAMYVRVLGHSDKIAQLQKEVAEDRGKQDGLDQRLRAIENTVIRVDTNVSELLRTQRSESPGRQQQNR